MSIAVTPPADQTATTGTPVTLSLGSFIDTKFESFSPEDQSSWIYIIHFGDGHTEMRDGQLGGPGSTSLGTIAHTYGSAGTFSLYVAVQNPDGDVGQGSCEVNVTGAGGGGGGGAANTITYQLRFLLDGEVLASADIRLIAAGSILWNDPGSVAGVLDAQGRITVSIVAGPGGGPANVGRRFAVKINGVFRHINIHLGSNASEYTINITAVAIAALAAPNDTVASTYQQQVTVRDTITNAVIADAIVWFGVGGRTFSHYPMKSDIFSDPQITNVNGVATFQHEEIWPGTLFVKKDGYAIGIYHGVNSFQNWSLLLNRGPAVAGLDNTHLVVSLERQGRGLFAPAELGLAVGPIDNNSGPNTVQFLPETADPYPPAVVWLTSSDDETTVVAGPAMINAKGLAVLRCERAAVYKLWISGGLKFQSDNPLLLTTENVAINRIQCQVVSDGRTTNGDYSATITFQWANGPVLYDTMLITWLTSDIKGQTRVSALHDANFGIVRRQATTVVFPSLTDGTYYLWASALNAFPVQATPVVINGANATATVRIHPYGEQPYQGVSAEEFIGTSALKHTGIQWVTRPKGNNNEIPIVSISPYSANGSCVVLLPTHRGRGYRSWKIRAGGLVNGAEDGWNVEPESEANPTMAFITPGS